ncbi:hypothetical protein ADL22_12690 [Streptomyces sp. NRRL F-4489]|uniref:hypothetical protein n=1 Tax=Streptomyces sp. NRRL F-4489 TaxID=1609095 RepID=UPI0007483311|nr:hypothetical protein [Streptomyces sp. NRRL F-4489]KUL44794.1 hypothetical protein ADL22_12690 [Streptomyces sp. NRRL F-4489]
MNELNDFVDFDEAAEAATAELYKNGKHYDAQWLRQNALKAEKGPNPVRKVVVDLGLGDSVDRLDSTKGQRIFGPQSVETIFWPDGGIDQRLYDLGEAPAQPRNSANGRFLDPNPRQGRKTGEYYDKDRFEWNGESKTAREWYEHPSRIDGLSLATFSTRLKKRGMSVQEALTTPVQRGGRRKPNS